MKTINLGMYGIIAVAALLVCWLVFDRFPWLYLPIESLEEVLRQYEQHDGKGFTTYVAITNKEQIVFALRAFEYIEYLFVYFVAGGLALAVIRFGEKQIFHINAETNWKVIVPLWILPSLFLGSSAAEHSNTWYSWLIICSYGLIAVYWLYSFLYHLSRGKSQKRSSGAVQTI